VLLSYVLHDEVLDAVDWAVDVQVDLEVDEVIADVGDRLRIDLRACMYIVDGC